MKLDDWLSQRSQSCPDRTALVADGAEMTYAELEAEATSGARRLPAPRPRRRAGAARARGPRRAPRIVRRPDHAAAPRAGRPHAGAGEARGRAAAAGAAADL